MYLSSQVACVGGWQKCHAASANESKARRSLVPTSHLRSTSLPFVALHTSPSVSLSAPAKGLRKIGLQLLAMMLRRLMAYTNVSWVRPGWPADRQVFAKARTAVVASAATADHTNVP